MTAKKQILLLFIPIIAYIIFILSTIGWKTTKTIHCKSVVIQFPCKSFNELNLNFSKKLLNNDTLNLIVIYPFPGIINNYKKSKPLLSNAFLDFQITNEDITFRNLHSIYAADSINVNHGNIIDLLLLQHKFSDIPHIPKVQK